MTRARILLKAGAEVREGEIAAAEEVVPATVERVRRQFCEGGFERALYDRRPAVGISESSKQLLPDVREPLPPQPHSAAPD